MAQTLIHKFYAPIRRWLPGWVSTPMRRVATAILTPVLFGYRTGHFRSSLLARAVGRNGDPLPWYTYPSIDFLRNRSYSDKTILEFGAGQSTLWWAARAKRVVSLEGDADWHARIAANMASNVELHLVSMGSALACVSDVERILEGQEGCFDVVVVDGLYRAEMAEKAKRLVARDGVIICDNAEGYGFFEVFRSAEFKRVDFYGYAPGIVLPHATSIFFRNDSFLFKADQRILDFSVQG